MFLILIGNREDLLVRTTNKLTADFFNLLSLLFTASHTEVNQNVIHNSKDNYDENFVIADVD